MANDPKDAALRLAYMYAWADASRLSCKGLAENIKLTTKRYVLITCAEGSGVLHAGGKDYFLDYGKCFLFKPDTTITLLNQSDFQLGVFMVEFDSLSLSKRGAPTGPGLGDGEYHVQPFTQLLELVQRLLQNRERSSEIEEYGNHLVFQEVIFMVLKAEAREEEDMALRAVERTILYIQASYSLDITHGKLAEMAGLSLRHYSRLFLKMTGKSPIDYLIQLRMNRAKQLLLTSGDSINEIASRIGFRDPFHFSRSFKQHTHVSPRLYVHLRKQNIRIASMQFLGELLTLGVKPAGAPSELLAGEYFKEQTKGIDEIGESVVIPYMDKLTALKPDAIVTFDGHHYSTYSKIAPTLTISWSLPMFDRFRQLAEWVGRQKEAEDWIDRYLEESEASKRLLTRGIGREQTVSFLWGRGLPSSVQVYFDMKVFYQDLDLKAPTAVTEVQQQAGHPFKADVRVEQLAAYAGDYIFIVVSEDMESQQQYRLLEQTEHWRELRAVRLGRVYRVSEDWIREDPISMRGQMSDVVRMLGK
jgi:ABC-type Fe3+-hydroxamate transport system substrate-binding protein